jgi:hypothetical protein
MSHIYIKLNGRAGTLGMLMPEGNDGIALLTDFRQSLNVGERVSSFMTSRFKPRATGKVENAK